jgi:hypothetical protein
VNGEFSPARKQMNTLYQYIAGLCILLISVLPLLSQTAAFALEEGSPSAEIILDTATDTTATPSVEIHIQDNTATLSSTIENTSSSGNNTVIIDTALSDDESELPEEIEEDVSDTSESNVSLSTGDSISVTDVVNQVQVQTHNSQIVNKTINLYYPTSGIIDLSSPQQMLLDLIAASSSQSGVIDAVVQGNSAIITNDIVAVADTGNNSVNLPGATVAVDTGNAYAVVTLTNTLNVSIVNSQIYIITINIFADFTGYIILPEPMKATCSGCDISINHATNSAQVTTQISASAQSGNNMIQLSGNNSTASITTGDSATRVSERTIANSAITNASFGSLLINTFGTWNGYFLGWGAYKAATGGASMEIPTPDTASHSGNIADIKAVISQNDATIQNNIKIEANTGANTLSSSQITLNTGNAYSAVCVTNFLNSIFTNSFGFFGCLNIFGNFTGHIGGEHSIPTATPTPTPQSPVSPTSTQSLPQTSGAQSCEGSGVFSISQSNNTGTSVNPGDTVTFFVTISNTGNAKITDTLLNLFLARNGQNTGGGLYSLPDIGPGKSVSVTTGLVLSPQIIPGEYTAVAQVTGKTCNTVGTLSKTALSTLLVAGSGLNTAGPLVQGIQEVSTPPQVSGISCSTCNWWWQILVGIVVVLGLLYGYALMSPHRRRVTMQTRYLVPVVAYLLFIWLQRGCYPAGDIPWWDLFAWHEQFDFIICRYYYLFVLFFYLLMTVIYEHLERWKNMKSSSTSSSA